MVHRFDGSQQTFPKLLQAAGYQTAVIGKWHLVSDPQGFDHWHILPGQGAYYNPPMIRDGEQVKHTGYTTDLISEFSIEWVKNRDKTKPFLLMTQHKAPHREWAPALRHLGWNGDREFPEPKTLFDDYSGRGIAELEQDMTLAKTFTERDAKLVPTPGLTPEQLAQWNAYYEPRERRLSPISPARNSCAGVTSATCTTTSARSKPSTRRWVLCWTPSRPKASPTRPL
jgi:arylsulfatase A-like enzyme